MKNFLNERLDIVFFFSAIFYIVVSVYNFYLLHQTNIAIMENYKMLMNIKHHYENPEIIEFELLQDDKDEDFNLKLAKEFSSFMEQTSLEHTSVGEERGHL